jgi:hypothetical protein
LEIHQILDLYTRQERIKVEFPGMRKDWLAHLSRHVQPGSGINFILYSDLDAEQAGPAIDEQVAYFRALRQDFYWKVYENDRPADLIALLQARGFELFEEETILVLELDDAPASLLGPTQVDLRRITRQEDLGHVVSVLEKVSGGSFDWIYKRLGPQLEVPNYVEVYAAFVDDQPVSAGWVYFTRGGDFASLWGGATIEAYRQRGLYTALLARRIQTARQQGKQFITINAGPMSKPIVEKYGFRRLTSAHELDWTFQKAVSAPL